MEWAGKKEVILSGTVICGDEMDAIDGYVCIRDSIISEVGEEKVDADLEGIICPRLVNAHVHIGDSVIKDPPFMPLQDLVGPDGLKHRTLAGTPRPILVEGMRRSLMEMMRTGTCAFADFREGGQKGVQALMDALDGIPHSVPHGVPHGVPYCIPHCTHHGTPLISKIFGRPPEGDIAVHPACSGIGISSTRDGYPRIFEAVARARSEGRSVAVHAGEGHCDDIDDALALRPDFLVHMTAASKEQLQRAAIEGIGIVVCPRSNMLTGSGLPDIAAMADMGITLAIGTDNIMTSGPDLFREMDVISRLLLHDDRQVFKMCTLNGAKILGIDDRIGSISTGKEGSVMVLDKHSDNLWGSINPLSSIVRRAGPSDILAVF